MKVACTCSPETLYDKSEGWLTHYNEGRRACANAFDKAAFADAHRIISVGTYAPVNNVQRVNVSDTKTRLQQIEKSLSTIWMEAAMLEEERGRLMRQLIDESPRPVPAEWSRSDVRGTCKACGDKTVWKRRGVYACHPQCVAHTMATKEEKQLLQDMLEQAIFGDLL